MSHAFLLHEWEKVLYPLHGLPHSQTFSVWYQFMESLVKLATCIKYLALFPTPESEHGNREGRESLVAYPGDEFYVRDNWVILSIAHCLNNMTNVVLAFDNYIMLT